MKKPAGAIALVAVLVAAVVGSLSLLNRSPKQSTGTSTSTASSKAPPSADVVATDSHRLQKSPDGSPVLVEFLDFECEGCREAYPFVEQLRDAALAVEAAAQQVKLQQMYSTMYERQAQWGEKQTSQAAVSRGCAKELGLDGRL